ncbi:MAG TPA: hypothetical protein VHO23_01165 [Candidatus Paceibacterota bacterium]|nr:hypothetical protein [Candidatus Paceibacterota bacterium]
MTVFPIALSALVFHADWYLIQPLLLRTHEKVPAVPNLRTVTMLPPKAKASPLPRKPHRQRHRAAREK